MSVFDLAKSQERAHRRLGNAPPPSGRKRRSDRGASRLDPAALDALREAAGGRERPPLREMLAHLRDLCQAKGVATPSRATVYKLLGTIPGAICRWSSLPECVRSSLYNFEPGAEVPAHQVAFYCVNYGDLRAVSYAAGLPWLAIYQALRLPGFRRKSRGLLEAVARVRKI